METESGIEANGIIIKPGDRVKTIEFGEEVQGILHLNKHPATMDQYTYFVRWDDGEETCLIDLKVIWKA